MSDPVIDLPDGWYLLHCPGCSYSVTWTRADMTTYRTDEWPIIAEEAVRHDCPAATPEPPAQPAPGDDEVTDWRVVTPTADEAAVARYAVGSVRAPAPLFSPEAVADAEKAIRSAIGAGKGYDGAAAAALAAPGVRREVEEDRDIAEEALRARNEWQHQMSDALALTGDELHGGGAKWYADVDRCVEEAARLRRWAEDRARLAAALEAKDTEMRAMAADLALAARIRDEALPLVDGFTATLQVALGKIGAVREVLDRADSGEFATAGRDFGRGVAEMARLVRAALEVRDDGRQDPAVSHSDHAEEAPEGTAAPETRR